MSKLKLREPIVWIERPEYTPEGYSIWYATMGGAVRLLASLAEDRDPANTPIYKYYSNYGGIIREVSGIEEAAKILESQLIEFGEKIFTIDKEQ